MDSTIYIYISWMSPPPSLVARALAGVEMSKRWALWF
jgi:hypothetical protein